ncbi:peptidase inhibitor 16-like [Melanotaenia boesemani]|uniref:peptidase inhibitor 16-like n=1 Tax=Melanotaenia boesemani TaxID=1250792 RepID=UPI001C04D846|nr:peptidase inhibitor 16-like [Melanotaenia boesemani]
MQRRSLSELQGGSTPRTTQDGASSWRSNLRMESFGFWPKREAPLWVWMLLGALLVPGAWSSLSEENEELLVELHNRYRGLVSPSASAMMPLKWDSTLKVIAEAYAAKCIWNHNPDLRDVGENLFVGNGPLDLAEALEKWFLENLDYSYQNNTCDEDKMCGHYTQMVWADTHRVGCAIHHCNTMDGLDWERTNFLVCNYYPAGNFENEQPYVEGDWCSQCPENLQKCENNLCVPDTEDEEVTDELSSQPPEILPTKWTDSPDQLATTANIFSILSTLVTRDFEGTPPPETTAEAADSLRTPSATPEQEEEAEENNENQEKEKKREESTKRKDEIWVGLEPKRIPIPSAGSILTPSVLLASLTGILTL